MPAVTPKDGASIAPAPVEVARAGQGRNDPVQVSAKIRALFDVLGPCIVRTCDGGTHVLSAEALKFVPFHEAVQ